MSSLVAYTLTPVVGAKKTPTWMRTAILDTATGDVFAPAFSELMVLCALHDGERFVMNRKRPYCRTAWIKRECPDYAEIADKIERKITAIHAVTA